MGRVQDKRIFLGMNQDDSEEFMEQGDYRTGNNIVVSDNSGQTNGVVNNIRGNEEVDAATQEEGFATIQFLDATTGLITTSVSSILSIQNVAPVNLPAGNNRCVGSYSDEVNNRIFYFNWNSNDDHGIYSVFYSNLENKYVFKPIFVTQNSPSTQVLVNTDNNLESTTSILNFDEERFIHSIALADDILSWTDGYNSPKSLDLSNTDITGVQSNPLDIYIDGNKYPPLFPPKVTVNALNYDGSKSYKTFLDSKNNFDGKGYQFIYRFTYKDKQKSTWSPTTLVTLTYNKENEVSEFGTLSVPQPYADSITLDFNNPDIIGAIGTVDPKLVNVIEGIDVAYRDFHLNEYRQFETIPFELDRNNKISTVVFKNEDGVLFLSKEETGQPYSNVPNFSETLTVVKDRKVYGHNTDGYDIDDFQMNNVGVTSTFDKFAPVNRKSFRWNSLYKVGVVWKNKAGKKSGVKGEFSVKTPEFRDQSLYNAQEFGGKGTNSTQKISIDFTIPDGVMPNWADSFDIVRTDNLSYNYFLETVSNDITYRIVNDDGTTTEITGEGNIIGTTLNGAFIYEGGSVDPDDDPTENRIVYTESIQGVGDLTGLYLAPTAGELAIDPGAIGTISGVPGGGNFNEIVGKDFSGNDITLGDAVSLTSTANQNKKSIIETADEVVIDIENITFSKLAYVFEEGDKIRIYQGFDGTNLFNYSEPLELEVLRQEGSSLVCLWDKNLKLGVNRLFNASFLEIVREKDEVTEDIFYDSGITFSRDRLNPSSPSYNPSFNYSGGDCYVIKRNIRSSSLTDNDKSPLIFDNWFNVVAMNHNDRYFEDWDKGLGRPNVEIKDEKRNVSKYQVRHGGKILVDSNINNLDSFSLLDNTESTPNEWGAVSKVEAMDNILVVLSEKETSSIYIEESIIENVVDGSNVGVSAKFFNNPRKMTGGFGCSHPASVVNYGKNIYWYSWNKQASCRYSTANGIYPISSYGMESFFKDAARKRTEKLPVNITLKNHDLVIGGYNPKYDMYYLTFPQLLNNGVPEPQFTIGFMDTQYGESVNKWVSFYDFIPESYGYVSDVMFTFDQGNPWEHDVSSVRNNFYGVQYNSNITLVGNVEPSMQKVFNNIMLEGNASWEVTSLTTPEGQVSDVNRNNFENINNEYWTDILCDKNTVGVSDPLFEGDVMEGNTVTIAFENDDTTEVRLFAANIFSQISERTNK